MEKVPRVLWWLFGGLVALAAAVLVAAKAPPHLMGKSQSYWIVTRRGLKNEHDDEVDNGAVVTCSCFSNGEYQVVHF